MSDNEKKEGRRILSGAELVSQGPNPYIEVEIPELGVDGEPAPVVYMKRLAAGMVIDFIADQEDPKKSRDSMMHLVQRSVVTPDGQTLFSMDDIEKLHEMRIDVFNRISAVLMKGLKKDEEIAKNESGGLVGVTTN